MVLENIIRLVNDVPSRVHIVEHVVERRTITDPGTGRPATRQVLVLEVDELDGRPVQAKLSIMAANLADKFGPYLPDGRYRAYTFVVTQSGEGFTRRWSVQALPRP